MEIKLFGAAKNVTGSCYSISTKDSKILVDCGLFQGNKDTVRLNYEGFGFDPSDYLALILTHAHLDHCGRIPKLVKEGFRGKIFATEATKELAFVILMDSANINAKDTEHENERRARQGLPPRKPLYNEKDVQATMKLFEVIDYDEDFQVTKDILAKFYDAGHILGSCSVQIQVKESKKKTLVSFSGDIGQKESIIVKNTEPIIKSEYVFIESTYGDRLHPEIKDREKELIRIVNESYKRGGKLMIPSFTVERAQEILSCLGHFMKKGLIPKMSVFLDSPMAMKATEVFINHPEYYNDTIKKDLKKGENPFSFPELVYTRTSNESKKLNSIEKPCIIIAGNGMCSAGRIKHHIKHSISSDKNTLLFVGFQVQGTLGYWLKQGEKRIKLLGVEVNVNAKIESIEGFSAHADYNELIAWLKNFKPKPTKVFITHGEESQSLAFSKRINKLGFNNYIPSMAEPIKL